MGTILQRKLQKGYSPMAFDGAIVFADSHRWQRSDLGNVGEYQRRIVLSKEEFGKPKSYIRSSRKNTDY